MIRLLATFLLVLGLVLMPLAMPGGSAVAAAPTTAASACPDHHQPDAPAAPEHEGALHCQMCAALPQADQADMPGLTHLAGHHATVNLARLAGIGTDVSDPPPKAA